MQSAFAYSSCTILKAKYMEKVNTKPVTVNCVKIMQWIMVSCCTEIIVCDVNMSLLQPQAIAKQHQATWGGGLICAYTSFTNQFPFFLSLIGQDRVTPRETNKIPEIQQMIRIHAYSPFSKGTQSPLTMHLSTPVGELLLWTLGYLNLVTFLQ